ncbi:MAG: TonB-dependent receptor [Burkholderiales bacterium]|nr:TonB-dependent receptor [Burkholderiales bacterium]
MFSFLSPLSFLPFHAFRSFRSFRAFHVFHSLAVARLHPPCRDGARLALRLPSRLRASLALPSCLAAACIGSAAQPASIVVTGSREPLARHQVAADVVVIDAERIRASGADSLEDLLRREAGLQLLRNGGPGQGAGLSIRGASRGQTLLLIDGVRVGSATLGTPELDTLTLAGVERVEVLRGPGSSLYGADALGGVVHVITRRAAAGAAGPALSLRTAAGGYGAREASLAGEGRAGPVDLAASVSEERQRGTTAVRPGDPFGNHNPDDDGFTRRTASARIGFEPLAGHRIGLVARGGRLNNQYDASEFAPPLFAPDNTGDFRNRVRDELFALDYRGAVAPAWTLSARLGDEYSRSVSGASQTSRFATRREQGVLQLSHAVAGAGQLTLALEQSDETASSTDYAADAARRNRAAVLAYAGALPLADMPALQGLAVQAELRADRNSVYGDNTTGRLGVRWPFAGAAGAAEDSAWSLRALAGNSFRAPSFNDLVYPGFGVPTVRPEKGRSVELGLDWRRGGMADASLTIYRQDQRDLIGFEPDAARCPPDPAYAFGCAANVQSARLQGASLDGRLRWAAAGGGSLGARLEWLDAKDRGTGQTLPRRARQQGGFSLAQQAGPVRLGAEVVQVGERPDFGVMLPAYTTLDLLAAWRPHATWSVAWLEGLEVQGKLLNATDRDIEPLRGYQALGRQAWVVLRWMR